MGTKIRNDNGQRATRTRAAEHAARKPRGDTRSHQTHEGAQQTRTRKLLKAYPTYIGARDFAATVEDPTTQIRYKHGQFGVYIRVPING